MKKLLDTGTLGGVPIYHPDLSNVLGAEVWAALQALLSPFDSDTEGVIVSGCVFSNNAGNFDMTAGIVYLNGEFMRIAAVTNQSFTKYIAPKTPISDSRTFENGTTNAVVQTKEAEIVGSAPGAGQYITVSSLVRANNRRLSGKIDIKVDLPVWDMDTDATKSLGAIPGFGGGGIDVDNVIVKAVVILDDTGQIYAGLASGIEFVSLQTDGSIGIGRVASGVFDSTDFNSTASSRGYIILEVRT